MKTESFYTWLSFLIAGVLIVIFNSCSKDTTPTVPSLITMQAIEITDISAKVGGEVTDDGGASVTKRGACYNTNSNPTINDNSVQSGSGTGTFNCTLTNLNQSTQYYYKAYAINSAGVGYGEQKTFSISRPCPGIPTITDLRDGQVYPTVQIGTQCWLQKNMNYETGNSWCYDNDPINCTTYGRLYDWETVMNGASSSNMVPSGVQGVCPPGWHVPSDSEWIILIDYLGGDLDAGGKMKEEGTVHWLSPNTGATNSSGFTALPGGFYLNDNVFGFLSYQADFWSSTENDSEFAWGRYLDYLHDYAGLSSTNKIAGLSARCLKD